MAEFEQFKRGGRRGSGVKGRPTSFYLRGDLDGPVHEALASGLTYSDLIERGLRAPSPDVALARVAAQEAAEAVRADVQEAVRGAVADALRELRGGSW